jgi:hypothetical protein
MGSCSLWHMHRARSGSRGLCLPATFRPQGLATLSTACTLARLVGLISCRQRLWDSPFGAFSSSKVAPALRPPHDPLAVTVKAPPTRTEIHAGCEPCKLGYRVLPSANPLRHDRVFSPTDRRRLPWVSPLSGVFTRSSGQAFRPASSHALIHRPGYPRRRRLRRRVSIDKRLARPSLAGHPS